ncbi:TPA: patatin-like phospholipase family protein [Clostridium botulinum]|uniref:Patatin-like phospholipase domain-containing protein n=1 Tax=Clostridium botulinum TaxID=1491 RepID=A0A140C2Z3_CLOBO|nr:CBASS cGAMP-activated phospholipase [Clostridium botulinum]ALT05648.1 patatin-like phospholipase domain-containing protein [Clostridium botulinum]ALT05749.1 patatin-like phospholipase domain-containing protein [Clostridium botulinum]ALT05851.1 patatin-like phospholipase domain-containing protein [Clostridium botulinum]HBJ2623057.1 patatin-like phospholipase family protein [Clostridium botulinum]
MLDWDKIKSEGWKPKNGECLKILSIDGGGIRGLFPAQYLANIEKATGKKINEFFDLIVGTSTGGIIALGLSVGIAAENISKLYENHATDIFKPSLFNKIFKKTGMIFKNSYSNKALINLLINIFDGKKIIDSDVMLCIPSLEHNKAKPKVYKTPHNTKYHWDQNLEMWKVAQATSAAPLYFPPAMEDGCKLDGGLWANNPILVGITEALHHNIKSENIKVLSIGTGENLYSGDNSIFKHGGLFSWKTNILDVFMNAQSYAAENTSNYLIKKDNLIRINFTSVKKIDLDCVSKSCLEELKLEADNSFKDTFKNNQNVEKNFFET